MSTRKTIAVIGGGSAGFTAARTAARRGAKVMFFMGDNADRATLCINAGCMPSKALFQPIDEMHHARRRGWWRVEPVRPAQLLAEIVAWKDREIAQFREHRQEEIRRCASDDFVIIRANARFLSAHTLAAAGQRYRADAIILATGSTPNIPAIDGIDKAWTSDDILDNTTLPGTLVVIGGGPVGLEFSLRYARLGCRVTVVSRSRLLAEYDTHFGERIASIYEREGLRVLTGSQVCRVKPGLIVEVEGPNGTESIASDRLLLATGRRPSLDSVAVAAAGITVNDDGRMEVGDDMRVAGKPHIFAVGDVNGQRMVVHRAHFEAEIAAENAVTDGRRRWERRSDLKVVFTDPEFAFAGATLSAANVARDNVSTARMESRDIGKLHLAGDDWGFGELIADATDHRLLGCGLLCADASELIHLPGYAIEHNHTVEDLTATEYYHPTKSELVAALANKLSGNLKLVRSRLLRA